jgi:hypothetical protein
VKERQTTESKPRCARSKYPPHTELRQDTMLPKRTIEDARKNVEILKKELLAAIGGKPLSPDEPFLDGLTLGEYLDLPEPEQARLWDKWTHIDLDDFNEVEVRSDAAPIPHFLISPLTH